MIECLTLLETTIIKSKVENPIYGELMLFCPFYAHFLKTSSVIRAYTYIYSLSPWSQARAVFHFPLFYKWFPKVEDTLSYNCNKPPGVLVKTI